MLTVQEQIYGATLIWSEAKYNFAFWDSRNNIDWDAAFQDVLNKVTNPMELTDYYLELMRFISLLNDGHTYIDFPKEIDAGLMTLPIKIKYRDGKHIITDTTLNSNIPLFIEICKINGIDIDTYMRERILPYCWNIKPSSSYEMLYTFCWLDDNADKNAYTFIPLIEKNKATEITTSDGVFTITPVPRNINWSLPQTLKSSETLTETFSSKGLIIEYTNDDIAVITLPTFMDDEMSSNFYKHLERLKSCKGFIIDVRDNGGGHSENADKFSQAFIKGKFETGKVKHAIHIGAYKAFGWRADFSSWDLTDSWQKKVHDVCNNSLFEEEITTSFFPECPLTLTQPVVILENAATGSSSENLLLNFDNIGRATIVGVPSYGSTGNPLFVKLPGGGYARICTRKYTYPNDKEFINIGIKPHVYADLTLDDLRNGRDSVLNKGLSVLRSQLM